MSESSLKTAEHKSFRDFCAFDSWKNHDDENGGFVGIRMENGLPKIHFPMGYGNPENEGFDEVELKGDFFRLMEILSDKALPQYLSNADFEKCRLDFPFRAFWEILEYYRDFGYFAENEIVYQKNFSGKISWPRTIRNCHPQVVKCEEEFRIAYLKPVIRRFRSREDNLIALVHKLCVHEAVKWIGPLFDLSEEDVEFPEIDFDGELFENVLTEKLNSTFNDRCLDLFRNLLLVTKFLSKKELAVDDDTENLFGVSSFAPVWEMLVDRAFGNFPPALCREDFNPHCQWRLGVERKFENPNYAMRPDTIMWESEKLFVLDAKYYRFGMSGSAFDLPTSGSICKQIAYAEYVESGLQIRGKKIYNAFLMPYCADARLLKDEDAGNRIFKMHFAGDCHGDWKNIKALPKDDAYRPYYHIAGILLDVKSLLRNRAANPDARRSLSQLIVRNLAREGFPVDL